MAERFETESEAFKADIVKLVEELKAKHLEHDDTVAQLQQLKELSWTQRMEVKSRLHLCKQHLQFCNSSAVVCVAIC